jgi:predicted SnoaL-like aldol condensation-catalyzing enzyme
MSIETNKAIVQRVFDELFNHRNLAVVDQYIAPGYLNHNASIQVRGPEAVKRLAVAQFEAFPDFHTTIEDIIAEGDKVVVRAADHFTRQSDGRQVTVTWIEILRLEDGKLVEAWSEADLSPIHAELKHALAQK